MKAQRYISTSWFTLSICPSVWGWYAVDGAPVIFRSQYSSFVNWATNWGPQSVMICLGIPSCGQISFWNNQATPSVVMVSWQGNKYRSFECQSTMFRIILCPRLIGNGPIRSMVIIFDGCSGIWVSTNSPFGICRISLVFGHMGHPWT